MSLVLVVCIGLQKPMTTTHSPTHMTAPTGALPNVPAAHVEPAVDAAVEPPPDVTEL